MALQLQAGNSPTRLLADEVEVHRHAVLRYNTSTTPYIGEFILNEAMNLRSLLDLANRTNERV